MPTRRERVWQYVTDHLGEYPDGITTTTIAAALGIARPNVSKELNDLVRTGKLAKTRTRPVRYMTAAQVAHRADHQDIVQVQDNNEGTILTRHRKGQRNPLGGFDRMIGRDTSLKNQIEQAKAALLYPPHGLNVLLTGPTGVGKTFFATAMNQFAAANQLITTPQLTVLNCADYAHTPKGVMRRLFGSVDGQEAGLLQAADGGMLLLNEAHRLPPAAQEMLFYFMEHGAYSRVGEQQREQQAAVRIICATTEPPESTQLQEFVRRIPITIQIPGFNQRTMRERLQLLQTLLTIEANRIDRNIRVDEDVVKALIGGISFGNVAQLKSAVQLVCAQAFLDGMDEQGDEIAVTFDKLPQEIQAGMSRIANDRNALTELTRLVDATMVVHPDGTTGAESQDSYELPYNLYEIIGHKAAVLKEEGLDQEAINNFIKTDINVHMKTYYREADLEQRNDRSLQDLVDQEFIDLTRKIKQHLEPQVDYSLGNNFVYAMSLHLSLFAKRVQTGKSLRTVSSNLIAMVKENRQELQLARQVKQLLEEHFHFPVPRSEVYYLAALLISLKEDSRTGTVGVVVAAHGSSTASSMVQVVRQLLDVNNVVAFDMGLDMSPTTAFTGITRAVQQVDQGNGVLLLVDMGSLATFSRKLTTETGIEVRTINMVTTAMVLEAARKTALVGADLDTIYGELREFHGYFRGNDEPGRPLMKKMQAVVDATDTRPRALLSICSSGEGTAKKIKRLLEEQLTAQGVQDVDVLPVSVVGLQDELATITTKYNVLGATGVVKPSLDRPFISLENLLQGGAAQFIAQVTQDGHQLPAQHTAINQSPKLTMGVLQEYLTKYFTFINADKLTPVLWEYCQQYTAPLVLDNTQRMSIIMHLAGAIERTLTASPLTIDQPTLATSQKDQSAIWDQVHRATTWLEERVNVRLALAEEYYIVQLLAEQYQPK